MKLSDLRKEIPFKVRKGPRNMDLSYIDARDAQDLLDEVVGPANWKNSYEIIGGTLYCTVYIKIDGEWVGKTDCGTESDIEKEKGLSSDAFKRACVHWGIGRFLYGGKTKSKSVSGGIGKYDYFKNPVAQAIYSELGRTKGMKMDQKVWVPDQVVKNILKKMEGKRVTKGNVGNFIQSCVTTCDDAWSKTLRWILIKQLVDNPEPIQKNMEAKQDYPKYLNAKF